MKAILVSLLFLCSCSTYVFNEEAAFEDFPSESDVAGWQKTDIAEFKTGDVNARRMEYTSINNSAVVRCTIYYSSNTGKLINLINFIDSSCFINNPEMIAVSSEKHANILYPGRMIEIISAEDSSAIEVFEKYYLSDKRKFSLPGIINLFDFNRKVRYNEDSFISGAKPAVYEGFPVFETDKIFFISEILNPDSVNSVSSFLLKRQDVLTETLDESRIFFIERKKVYDVVSVRGNYIFGFYGVKSFDEGKYLIEKTGKLLNEKRK